MNRKRLMVAIGSSEREDTPTNGDGIRELNQRNTKAVEVALEEVHKKLFQALEVISQQQTAIGSLMARMDGLEQRLVLQKVQMTGLGPSVKLEE